MEVIRFDLDHLPEPCPGLCLALGNFDGVHQAHRRLFSLTAMDADGETGVLLFAKPYGSKGPYLSSVEDKVRLCLNSHLDRVYVLQNDEALYDMEPQEFILRVLLPLGTSKVYCGEDFRFGKDRQGDPRLLAEFGLSPRVAPMMEDQGEKISSRRIKALLREGKVEEASRLLTADYEIRGKVVEGFHNGEKLGFPTLNIRPEYDYVLPRIGVYAGVVYVSGIAHMAMINVGTNPTIGKLDHPVVEAHLLDYDQEAYGLTCYCSFKRFLRDEQTFATLEELKAQLEQDERKVRAIFAE